MGRMTPRENILTGRKGNVVKGYGVLRADRPHCNVIKKTELLLT